MKISTATAQGRRPYQEDRFVVAFPKGGLLFAVIDGHGGSTVAENVKTRLPFLWEQYGLTIGVEHRIRTLFFDLCQENRAAEDGAAVSLVYLTEGMPQAYVAILGDAPVVIRDHDGNINVSPEHNVRSNLAERESITKKGGYYWNGYAFPANGSHGLQMSRALGDAALDSILNREPEIYTVPMNKDSFILLGTDGLFDPSHQDLNVAPIVALVNEGKTAQDLVDRAVALPTHDNATAILVTF